MEQEKDTDRDFGSISPSAKWLLHMKGHTDIPFARQVAEFMEGPGGFAPDFTRKDISFWARTIHFETRYRSIEALLKGLPVNNILELSSGYSFRGLEYSRNPGIHYIDTDLPDVIALKKRFMESLKPDPAGFPGVFELLPLNALEKNDFDAITGRFPPGKIAIVNEGLLMYLAKDEKKRLCAIIREILERRGGWWITADIYLKNKLEKFDLKLDERTKEFFERQNIEANKFESFEEAETFFKEQGFTLDAEARVNIRELGSFKYFMQNVTGDHLMKFGKAGKANAAWRLKVAE